MNEFENKNFNKLNAFDGLMHVNDNLGILEGKAVLNA